jgi:glycosyltransferase involved in cell wall biosynthesis
LSERYIKELVMTAPPEEARTQDPIDDKERPVLSIIIPAYNEEKRLPDSLRELQTFLAEWQVPAEVIVVDNASTDATAAIVSRMSAEWSALRLIQAAPPGKGLAVREGLLAARGDYSFFCDADFSMPVREIIKFFPPYLGEVEVAIATREGPSARRFGEPQRRHIMGRVYNALVRNLVLPGIQDSQCGFKCLRADIGRRLAGLQTVHGWGFDVELLALARHFGYQVVEVPIDWYYAPSSRIHPLRDSWRMTRDLFVVRRNLRLGSYDIQSQAEPTTTGSASAAHSTGMLTSPPGSHRR